MCHSRLKLQSRNLYLSYGDGKEWLLFFLFFRGVGGDTIFHEFNTRGYSGSDMGSSPAMEQRALCPRLNEKQNRIAGLVYSALTRGALIYAFAMLGSGGVGPDY